jgi:hypothetical protein
VLAGLLGLFAAATAAQETTDCGGAATACQLACAASGVVGALTVPREEARRLADTCRAKCEADRRQCERGAGAAALPAGTAPAAPSRAERAGAPAGAATEQPAAAPATDIQGYRLGMTPAEVRALAKSQSRSFVDEDTMQLEYLAADGTRKPVPRGAFVRCFTASHQSQLSPQFDGIQVCFTPGPDGERAVGIQRDIRYATQEVSVESVEAALVQKYGPATLKHGQLRAWSVGAPAPQRFTMHCMQQGIPNNPLGGSYAASLTCGGAVLTVMVQPRGAPGVALMAVYRATLLGHAIGAAGHRYAEQLTAAATRDAADRARAQAKRVAPGSL